MTIAILIDGLNRGGAERQALNALWQQSRMNQSIELIHYHPIKDTYSHPAFREAQVTYIPKGKNPLTFLWRLCFYLSSQKIDIVHGFKGTASFYAALAGKMAGVPVILGGFRMEFRQHSAARYFYKFIDHLNDGWIVNSNAVVESMSKNVGIKREKFFLVPNGINSSPFKSKLTREEAKRKLGISANIKTVSIVARLVPQKNHELFLDMAAILTRAIPHVCFIIAGEGELRTPLEDRVHDLHLSDDVLFLGNRTDISDIYAATDVLVSTSFFEGQPNNLIESMAAGIPIVTTNFAGVDEVVTNRQNGFICPQGDAGTLAARVQHLLENAGLRIRMGAHGQQTAAQFSIEHMATRLNNVYAHCLEKARPLKFRSKKNTSIDNIDPAGLYRVEKTSTPNNRLQKSLAIFGSFPPPYGGVSVHLKRLQPYLETSPISYIIYNTGINLSGCAHVQNSAHSVLSLLKMCFCSSFDAAHFHTSTWCIRTFAAVLSKLKHCRLIFTAHGASLTNSITNRNPIIRFCAVWALRQTDLVIATNTKIKTILIDHGFSKNSIVVLPAFIPPVPVPSDFIPKTVMDFCSHHTPILMATAGFSTKTQNDVYGFSNMRKLIQDLKGDYPHIGLVIYLAKHARQNGNTMHFPLPSEHILLYASEEEFYPALKQCDLFIRPTTTDGDANSIREAHWAGVPVVASNVVPRPEGCLTYDGESYIALKETVKDVLEHLQAHKKLLSHHVPANPVFDLIRLYQNCLYPKS